MSARRAMGAPACPLAVERIAVRPDRLVLDVRVPDPALRHTTPQLAAAACAARPNLPRHACVNDEGPTFAAVVAHTSLPHLFEHLVIDFQTAAAGDAARVFTGLTEWTDAARGRARVQVSMESDAAALRAVNAALSLLERLSLTAPGRACPGGRPPMS